MTASNLLADRTYDIEFSGYLSNHAKHAIIALDKIDAPDERIQQWWDGYTDVTPYGLRLHRIDREWDDVVPATRAEWTDLRGRKEKWMEMCALLRDELSGRFDGDTDRLVREYAPDLIPGMAGALTHGIIHLGWAIDAGSEWMIVEGLAYLNFCYLGVDPYKIRTDSSSAPESESPLRSLVRVAGRWEADNLATNWVQAVKSKYGTDFHPELVPAGFQWELSKVLHEPHDIATSVPRWLAEDTDVPIVDLWESLYRTVTLVYLATRDGDGKGKGEGEGGNGNGNGNFLVLHAITSLWGLEHVLRVLGDDDVTRRSLQQYYSMLICLLSASSSGFPPSGALIEADSKHPPVANADSSAHDWTLVVTKAMAEKEEHNIKLTYVCRELWKRYGHWSGFYEAARSFTLTPNIGPKSTGYKS